MSSVDLTAGTVMDKSASLLNDTAKTVYTYTAQLPYLQMALQELQEFFELNTVPVTESVSAVINIPVGISQIVYNGVGVPALPTDFVEPNQLWECATGTDTYVPMTRRNDIPKTSTPVATFGIYVWQGQAIKFPASNRINDIKLDYIRQLFTPVVDQFSIINIVNAATFLQYRTAALCAEFIERNKTSSDALNVYASLGIDRASGIGVKSKQNIMTRRKPFRSSYKRS